jgi:Ca2+-binding EF-hand superfamily protein
VAAFFEVRRRMLMRRLLFLVPILLITVSLSGSEDRKKGTPDKPRPETKADRSTPGKADKSLPFFDVDSFIKEYDKNGDGYLSKDELPARYRWAFDKMDTNKDGKLSRDELIKGIGYLRMNRRPSDVVMILVEMSDCDECAAEELQRMYELLRKLDKKGEGKITADSLKEGRTAIIRERIDNILRELDTNKDGKISREEARGQIKKFFDEIDTNKDGYISREELLKAAEARPLKVLPRPGTRPLKKESSERRKDR